MSSRNESSWNKRKHASIVFYDNERGNINDVDSVWNMDPTAPNIACNHINDKIPNILLSDPDQRDINYTNLHIFDHNTYVIHLRSINYKEIIVPCQGFSDSHRTELIEWILHKQGKPFIVVFDWDQTVSVTNGIILPPVDTPEMCRECAQYLLGGYQRWNMFQELEKFILEKNGEIYILTSNPLADECGYPRILRRTTDGSPEEYDFGSASKRPLFLKLIQQVFSSMNDKYLLSSYQDGRLCSKGMRLLTNNLFFNSVKRTIPSFQT
jgi:hypothetical protein